MTDPFAFVHIDGKYVSFTYHRERPDNGLAADTTGRQYHGGDETVINAVISRLYHDGLTVEVRDDRRPPYHGEPLTPAEVVEIEDAVLTAQAALERALKRPTRDRGNRDQWGTLLVNLDVLARTIARAHTTQRTEP